MKKGLKFKKSILAAFLASGICLALPFSVSAATIESESIVVEATGSVLLDESVEYFSDGSSITTRLYEHTDFNQIANYNTLRAASYSKEGLKTVTYKDTSGKTVWDYTVRGKFTINTGVSATCTAVAATPQIYDSTWSVSSNKPSRSGNTAKGVVVMQKKSAGAVVKEVTKTVTVKCDANGVIS